MFLPMKTIIYHVFRTWPAKILGSLPSQLHWCLSHVESEKTHMNMDTKRFFSMAGNNIIAEELDLNDDERVPTTDSEIEPLAYER